MKALKSVGVGALVAGLGCLLMGLDNGEAAPDVLHGEREFLVLSSLPRESEVYREEAQALVREGVPERYGREEWDSVLLTHEIHQHLGIYTTIGAKMGVRARELLGAPMRSVYVVAHTGREQPLACLADGLQVALGSTLGQGLIEVPDAETPSPSATFRYGDRVIRLRLKEAAKERIREIIERASKAHGFQTPEYFEALEAESYRVWAEFDRREIFEEAPAH